MMTVVYQNLKTSYWSHRQESSSSKKAANRWKRGCKGMVWVVIACKEKYKIHLEEWRHWSYTRKMKKRQKESNLGRKKEVKRGRTAI
jgi:hypothetical protein